MRSNPQPTRAWTLITKWWPFALLCIVSSGRIIFAEDVPRLMSTAISLAVAGAAACVMCLAVGLARKEGVPTAASRLHSLTWGALLFCGLHVALFLQPKDVAGSDLLLAGSLTAVGVGVTLAAQTDNGLSTYLLLAGIAAPAGLLVMLPEPRIHSLAGVGVMVLLPVMAGAGATMISLEAVSSPLWNSASAFGGVAVAFAFLCLVQHRVVLGFSALACGLDLATLLCTLLTLRRLGAIRYAAAFVLVPLGVLVYGFVLLRPELTLRIALGFCMLTASFIALLRHREEKQLESLLHLLR